MKSISAGERLNSSFCFRIMAAVVIIAAVVFCLTLPNDDSYAADPGGSCGPDLTWTYIESTQTLSIEGTGNMEDFSTPPWAEYRIKHVSLPDGLTSIGSRAFQNCRYLTDAAIPDTVTAINDYSFYGCRSLTSIYIPAGVTSINFNNFTDCDSLTSITVADGNTSYKSVDGVLLTYDGKKLIKFPAAKTGDFTIPDGVNTVDGNAFSYARYLTSVTIPSGVTQFNWVFSGCVSLRSVSIPDTVTFVGYNTFSGCTALTSVEFPDSIGTINQGTFSGCTSLTSVKLPAGITSLPQDVFRDCISLTSVSIPNSVTFIGYEAFRGCTALTSIAIPESANMGSYAFRGCTSLTTVSLPASLTNLPSNVFQDCVSLREISVPAGVKYINTSAFEGCASLTAVSISGATEISNNAFKYCTSLETIDIPATVTAIGSGAFDGCTSLKQITLPTGMTKISAYTFNGCTSLTSVTIPEGVESIQPYAFCGCTALTSVAIPSTVTLINYSAFERCTALTSVTIPEGVKTISNYAFRDCVSLTSVTIPSTVTLIANEVFNRCTSLTSIDVAQGNATYRSTDGVLFVIETDCLYQYPSGKTGETYTVPDNTKIIGANAFDRNTHLTEVTMPSTVTGIYNFAFRDCGRLTKVDLPNSIVSIGDYAFFGCVALESVTIPESVTSIGGNAFAATALREVTIPSSVPTISNYAFGQCTSLEKVNIGVGVTAIGNNAFRLCKSLETVTIPNSVTSISDGAFIGCFALKSVYIPESVTAIGDMAFSACTGLSSIEVSDANTEYSSQDGVLFDKDKTDLITYPAAKEGAEYSVPSTVTYIWPAAFANCQNLEKLTISASVSEFNTCTIQCNKLKEIAVDASNEHLASVDGVLYNAGKTALLMYPMAKEDSTLELPDTVIGVYENAFTGPAVQNITKVVIPKSFGSGSLSDADFMQLFMNLEEISVSQENVWFSSDDGVLFDKDKKILVTYPIAKRGSEYAVPDTVEEIYTQAFAYNKDLETVRIPASVLSISPICFLMCDSLESIEVDAKNLYYASDDGVLFDKAKTTLISYPAAKGGSSYTIGANVTILDVSMIGLKNLKSIEVDPKNIKYVSINGLLCEKYTDALKVCPGGLRSVSIPGSIDAVRRFAFSGDNLSSVTFEGGKAFATVVGMGAFVNCTSLEQITIEDGNNVTFEMNAITYSTVEYPDKIYVDAPEGYHFNLEAVPVDTEVVYGKAPSDKGLPVLVYVAIGVVALLAVAGVAYLVIRKKKSA